MFVFLFRNCHTPSEAGLKFGRLALGTGQCSTGVVTLWLHNSTPKIIEHGPAIIEPADEAIIEALDEVLIEPAEAIIEPLDEAIIEPVGEAVIEH